MKVGLGGSECDDLGGRPVNVGTGGAVKEKVGLVKL